MGEHGRRHVDERYSVERLLEDVDLLYRELMRERGLAACHSAPSEADVASLSA